MRLMINGPCWMTHPCAVSLSTLGDCLLLLLLLLLLVLLAGLLLVVTLLLLLLLQGCDVNKVS
jgi:hypothetical protein